MKLVSGILGGSSVYRLSGIPTVPRVCVVGSGPAGFYVAQHLVKNNASVEVDIYEKLPVPFGLVRYGVAPDHPEVKNVINTFTRTARHPRVNFYGNVSLGENVMLRDLQHAYHSIVLAYGADTDRELGVVGEKLDNVVSARKLVGWYNGLPKERDLFVDLDTDTAVVLGQGNVAIDVARILLTHVDQLKKTDMSSYAIAALAASRVRRVVMVGRRGPLHVAFTIKELREMLRLPGVHTQFISGQMDRLQSHLDKLSRARRRLSELLLQAAATPLPSCTPDRSFHLMFLRSPVSFSGDTHVSAVQLAINTLQGDRIEEQKAVALEEQETLPCGLVLRSIGYRSVAVDPDLPFDPQNHIIVQKPGLYAAGWVATGPVGVILSTMTGAFDTAATVLRDLSSGAVDSSNCKPGAKYILNLLHTKGVVTVDFTGWEKIDAEERQQGCAAGKSREKIVDIAEMLKIGGSI